jgi:formate dehydrogenase subunit delta
MTTDEKLVMMVNQIAANLMHEVDPVAATAHHIRLYWDPRMKAQIKAHGGEGLTPTALAAVGLV